MSKKEDLSLVGEYIRKIGDKLEKTISRKISPMLISTHNIIITHWKENIFRVSIELRHHSTIRELGTGNIQDLENKASELRSEVLFPAHAYINMVQIKSPCLYSGKVTFIPGIGAIGTPQQAILKLQKKAIKFSGLLQQGMF